MNFSMFQGIHILPDKSRFRRYVFIWLIACCVLMVSAPFGTSFLSFGQRLLYWPIMVGAALILSGILRFVIPSFGTMTVLRDAVVGAVFALCFVPVIWIMTEFVLRFSTLTRDDLVVLLRDITVFSIAVSIVRGRLERRRAPLLTEEVAASAEKPRLFERLEANGDVQIMRLVANDHYVEVVLDNGNSERLLLRLRDAVAEIEPVEGLYTHRSHWVCQAFVVSGRRIEGRDFIEMADGALVPVSRTFKAKVIENGITF